MMAMKYTSFLGAAVERNKHPRMRIGILARHPIPIDETTFFWGLLHPKVTTRGSCMCCTPHLVSKAAFRLPA